MERQRFPGISYEAFSSETDRQALEALKKVPLLPMVITKFHELGLDRWMYCWNMATSVRCGPNQYPSLMKILEECCEVLDMPVPELYVTSNPFPNAFAGGVERPYITLRSSIIDTLDDAQLYHLIGHELGHIKAGHILYFSVARVMMQLLEMLGRRTLGVSDVASVALVIAYLEWSRKAEITADRAGLLCSQSFDTSAGANLCLAAGPNRLSGEQNVEAFLEQARAYQDMNALDSIGKVLIFYFFQLYSTHPMPVERTKALEKWHLGGTYEKIMQGHYIRVKAA